MPEMTDFSCLGILRLRCVRSIASGTKPFILNCFGSGPSFQVSFRSFESILEDIFWRNKTLLTYQITVAANYRLQHRDRRVIFHNTWHFHQLFLKFEFSKKFSCGPPLDRMPQMTDFSCLGNLRLSIVVSGTKPLSLNCFGSVPSFQVSFSDVTVTLGRGFPKSGLTIGILSAFWRAFFGQWNARNSTNNGGSEFSTAASWSVRHFNQYMTHGLF